MWAGLLFFFFFFDRFYPIWMSSSILFKLQIGWGGDFEKMILWMGVCCEQTKPNEKSWEIIFDFHNFRELGLIHHSPRKTGFWTRCLNCSGENENQNKDWSWVAMSKILEFTHFIWFWQVIKLLFLIVCKTKFKNSFAEKTALKIRIHLFFLLCK